MNLSQRVQAFVVEWQAREGADDTIIEKSATLRRCKEDAEEAAKEFDRTECVTRNEIRDQTVSAGPAHVRKGIVKSRLPKGVRLAGIYRVRTVAMKTKLCLAVVKLEKQVEMLQRALVEQQVGALKLS